MIVRCTAKARALLGVRQLAEPEPSDDDLYANLLWFERRKCLLLVHAGTLFPVFVPDVRKADLSPLDRWLADVIGRALNAESLPDDALGALSGPALVAKTASRHILGVMSEMAWSIECVIADAGGLAHCDIADLNRHQRRILHKKDGDYVRPIELARLRQPGSSNSRQA